MVRLLRIPWAAASAAVLAASGGCVLTPFPASPERATAKAQPVPDSAWPDHRATDATLGRILAGGVGLASPAFGAFPPTAPAVPDLAPRALGPGLVQSAAAVVDEHPADFWKDPNDPGDPAALRFNVALWHAQPSGRAEWPASDARMNASCRFPSGAPVGLAVVLPGQAGAKFWEVLQNQLLSHGWALLNTSVPSLGPEGHRAVPYRDLDPAERADPAWKHARGAMLAERVDRLMADHARLYEGAIDYVQKRRPDLGDAPILLVGLSYGALVTPPVAARLGNRVSGVVLVGAGGNLARIMALSTRDVARFNGSLTLDDGVVLDRAEMLDVADEYLAASRLDPLRVAPSLRATPVLMLHGATDRVVPAATGEAIWESLGRPERWQADYGHELLFWFLPYHAVDIADWADREVLRRHPLAMHQ